MKDFKNISIKEFNDEFKRKVKEDDIMSEKDFKKKMDLEKMDKVLK